MTQGTRVVLDMETIKRRRRETAKVMLRIIADEQAHGIFRPDAETFKTRMERQAVEG